MKPLVGADSDVWPSFDVPPLHNLARVSGLFIFLCLISVMFQLNMTVLSTISRERKQQNTWFVMKTGRSARPCDVGKKLLFLRGLEARTWPLLLFQRPHASAGITYIPFSVPNIEVACLQRYTGPPNKCHHLLFIFFGIFLESSLYREQNWLEIRTGGTL